MHRATTGDHPFAGFSNVVKIKQKQHQITSPDYTGDRAAEYWDVQLSRDIQEIPGLLHHEDRDAKTNQ